MKTEYNVDLTDKEAQEQSKRSAIFLRRFF